MEGLVQLPYLLGHRHEQKDLKQFNCDNCVSDVPVLSRQRYMGCAYLPPVDVRIRQVEGAPLTVLPSVCPGYSCALPEVQEVRSLHIHWSKGALTQRLDEDQPTSLLMGLIEVYEGAQNAAESYFIKPEQDRND